MKKFILLVLFASVGHAQLTKENVNVDVARGLTRSQCTCVQVGPYLYNLHIENGNLPGGVADYGPYSGIKSCQMGKIEANCAH